MVGVGRQAAPGAHTPVPAADLSEDAARFLATERQIDQYNSLPPQDEAVEQVVAGLLALEREIVSRMATTPSTRQADLLAKARVLDRFFDDPAPGSPAPYSCDNLVRSLIDDLLDPRFLVSSEVELLRLEGGFDVACAVAHAARAAGRHLDNAGFAAVATRADAIALRMARQIDALPAFTRDGVRIKSKATSFIGTMDAGAGDCRTPGLATEGPALNDVAATIPSSSALYEAPQPETDTDPTVNVNLKLSRLGALAIARAAGAAGTTQKVLITQALQRAGVPLPSRDLEDRTPRRRT